jgi:ribosomal protein L21
LVKYLLLVVSQVLVIKLVITQKYSLQEEIPETIVITITINHHHKVSKVILIKEDPKAALNREHG